MFKGIFLGFLLSNSFLIAQSLSGSGYAPPAPVSVAPGQIATFYVPGVQLTLVNTPPGTPPTVTLQQNGVNNTPAPIQSIRVVSQCPDVTAISVSTCGSLTAITVQIPYELVPYCPLCAKPVSATPPLLTISQNGQALTSIELNPLADEVHVLTACDVALGPPPQPPNLTGLPCAPLVTHTNGTLVSAASPANPGETLTAWAFGLGQTTPAATTGEPATMGVTLETFNLNFNYQINALPAKPYTGDPDTIQIHPLFSGLAPGYVGLYQVNFTVPAGPPNGIAQCSQLGAVALGGNAPQSNLTVSIGGQFSFDGAGICVATQIPVD